MKIKCKNKKSINPSIEKKIGEYFEFKRKMQGLHRQKLSEMLGISHQQIRKYEKGTNRLSLSTFYALCKILKINPDVAILDINKNEKPLLENNNEMQLVKLVQKIKQIVIENA